MYKVTYETATSDEVHEKVFETANEAVNFIAHCFSLVHSIEKIETMTFADLLEADKLESVPESHNYEQSFRSYFEDSLNELDELGLGIFK